jgi:hypothetical protein
VIASLARWVFFLVCSFALYYVVPFDPELQHDAPVLEIRELAAWK